MWPVVVKWIQVVCCWAGLLCTGWSQTALDIRDVPPDLTIPPVVKGEPRAGRRVSQTLKGYPKEVYHVLHLPSDWQPSHSHPVIVEYTGNGPYKNKRGDVCTGFVEDSKLGYGITGGKNAIWLCLPYLNNDATANVRMWWGDAPSHDVEPTVDYCKKAVACVCEKFGGDSNRVMLVGFSRGAIACNYVGLHDDKIARLWKCMIPFSHYDGVRQWGFPASDRRSAAKRLARLGRCPQLICSENTGGKSSLGVTREYLGSTRLPVQAEYLETGFHNHNDAWILRPSEARVRVRRWASKQLGLD